MSYSEITNFGNTPLYLWVDTTTSWIPGRIYVNDKYIGYGSSPVFSYGKDRLAFINHNYYIVVTDGEKRDTISRLAYWAHNQTVSWDSSGHLYYTERLNIIKIDTSTKIKDTVYRFPVDYLVKQELEDPNNQLMEGNVDCSGNYAAFTLYAGRSATYNSIWYIDVNNKIEFLIMTKPASCQSALSYDNSLVAGTPYSHTSLRITPIHQGLQPYDSSLSIDMNLPSTQRILTAGGSFWVIRFMKFLPDFVLWYDYAEKISKIANCGSPAYEYRLPYKNVHDIIADSSFVRDLSPSSNFTETRSIFINSSNKYAPQVLHDIL